LKRREKALRATYTKQQHFQTFSLISDDNSPMGKVGCIAIDRYQASEGIMGDLESSIKLKMIQDPVGAFHFAIHDVKVNSPLPKNSKDNATLTLGVTLTFDIVSNGKYTTFTENFPPIEGIKAGSDFVLTEDLQSLRSKFLPIIDQSAKVSISATVTEADHRIERVKRLITIFEASEEIAKGLGSIFK
jgi:hypothetical protein